MGLSDLKSRIGAAGLRSPLVDVGEVEKVRNRPKSSRGAYNQVNFRLLPEVAREVRALAERLKISQEEAKRLVVSAGLLAVAAGLVDVVVDQEITRRARVSADAG